jgi:hypothetical protein
MEAMAGVERGRLTARNLENTNSLGTSQGFLREYSAIDHFKHKGVRLPSFFRS